MSKINQDSALRGRDLPPELLELILSKLISVIGIKNFQSVCKTWRSITVRVSPPRQLPSPLSYADPSFPLLFQIMENDGNKYRVTHPLYNYTWDFEFPPQLRDGPNRRHWPKKIHYSKYGWSLINVNWSLILFNPLTQEIIELPSMPFLPGYSTRMFFTAPPSHPDCSIVAITFLASINVHKLGEADWKKHDLTGKMDRYFRPVCHPILYQGLCYCLDSFRNLGVFDIRDIENTWTVHETLIPIPLGRQDPAIITALVEHDGQLLAVFIDRGDRPYIFKLDVKRKTKSCVQMQTCLGKNSLFISRGTSFSQRAIVSGTANKIFVPFLRNNIADSDSFLFYSLATRKYHSFFHNLSRNRLSDMEFHPYTSWLPL